MIRANLWFVSTRSKWQRRAQRSDQIGRMYPLSPLQGDVYYLRCLLAVVPGPTSFEDLRTVEGVRYETFQDACCARGIVGRDNEWDLCFADACEFQAGWYLRRLFVSAMVYGGLTDASSIWEKFKDNLCEGLMYTIRQRGISHDPALERPDLDYGLYLIYKDLLDEDVNHELGPLGKYSLPNFQNDWELYDGDNPLIQRELEYDRLELRESAATREAQLNDGQCSAYNRILASLQDHPEASYFFVNGPGGTGKTFLYNTLCDRLRSEGKIVLCVATTGVAAQLLPGGRTAHKRFKIPIPIDDSSTCRISWHSAAAELIRAAHLIIWDETPMTHRHVFDAVDRTLRDVRKTLPGGDQPFGGIPVVLGGDFQQILPVVPHGGRQETVAASMQQSVIWPYLERLSLTENMRLNVNSNPENATFAKWLAEMSHDPQHIGTIPIPSMLWRSMEFQKFVERIYPPADLQESPKNPDFFIGRAILTPTNEAVIKINEDLLEQLPGEVLTFNSDDSADINDAGHEELTREVMATMNCGSLPLSPLQLKVGAPVMLLRNLDPIHGLCNGTRMTVLRASTRCLEVRLNGGKFDGERRLIYRTKLTSNDEDFHCRLTRLQFPIRLAFAMTINKAQGQSLDHVGIDLRTPVFSHGQLYVALSRATEVSQVSILIGESNVDEVTDNVVYPEVLQALQR
jgi:PIF1-like helicase/Helicase